MTGSRIEDRGSRNKDRGSGITDRGTTYWSRLVFAIVLLTTIGGGRAQAQEPGSELTVFLVTIGVGDLVYERFGHNAIWIHDSARGTDFAYNWGMFAFGPGFIPSFLKGRMEYTMGPQQMSDMMYEYRVTNRTVWAQELNLTNAQKSALQQYVEWNALPENRNYRYDYYRDNCSTRVRDVLDRVLSGQLRRTLEPKSTGTTYRSETRRLMLTDIATLTGMNLAMGPAIDQPLSAWTQSFIPMRLRDWLRDIKVPGPNGEQPLVRSERILFQADRAEPPDVAPNLVPWYLFVGVVIASLVMVFGVMPQRVGVKLFGVLAGFWSFTLGILGTLIAGLWAFTDHSVTYRNENVLLANTLWLLLLVALIGWALGKRWGLRLAQRTSLVLAALSALALVLQVLPGFDQANGDIIALLLPTSLAFAWVLHRKRQRANI